LFATGAVARATVSAEASAFLEPPGQGEIITAASFSDSTRFFDRNGKLIPIPAYQKFDLGSYIEYGASDRVTIVIQPFADIAHQNIVQPVQPFAATTDLGARFGLASFGSTVISVQVLAHLPLTNTSTASGLFDQDPHAGRGFSSVARSWLSDQRYAGISRYGCQPYMAWRRPSRRMACGGDRRHAAHSETYALARRLFDDLTGRRRGLRALVLDET
jgi:hypothetical protein